MPSPISTLGEEGSRSRDRPAGAAPAGRGPSSPACAVPRCVLLPMAIAQASCRVRGSRNT